MKLSFEERDDLQELTLCEGYRVLLKVIDAGVRRLEANVLECDLGTDSKDELANRKLRAEGAAQLARAITSMLDKTKHPPQSEQKAKKGRLAT